MRFNSLENRVTQIFLGMVGLIVLMTITLVVAILLTD
jgi:hypothetical protein